MASFDVLEEGWIPVETLDGKRELLGIRQVLKRAHTLRAIRDASPLIEYSLYRFMQVFLMDALRPEDSFKLEDMLETGRFDMEAIDAYIAACEAEGVSFDLFDEKRPFLQVPYEEKWDAKTIKPIQTLDCTLPSGNNHVHFDHRGKNQFAMQPPEAARLTLETLLFCTAMGAKGYPSGVNASPPYYAVIDGRNLFETLCYTLIPINEIKIALDQPPVLWRYQEAIEPKKVVTSTSWLLGMLFPTRRIHLIPEDDGAKIQSVYLSQGMNYINKDAWTDPCVTYRYLDSGRVPLRPQREKAVWRNFYDLIDVKNQHAPAVLRVYQEINMSRTIHMTLYGVETNNANYLQVMRHTLQFPVELAECETYVRWMRNMNEDAEALARSLKKALENPKVLPTHVASSAVQRYYDGCEQSFWKLCCIFSGAEEDVETTYTEWINEISKYARKAYEQALTSIELSAKELVAISKSEYILVNGIMNVKGVTK